MIYRKKMMMKMMTRRMEMMKRIMRKSTEVDMDTDTDTDIEKRVRVKMLKRLERDERVKNGEWQRRWNCRTGHYLSC